jgi:hypothetical protein
MPHCTLVVLDGSSCQAAQSNLKPLCSGCATLQVNWHALHNAASELAMQECHTPAYFTDMLRSQSSTISNPAPPCCCPFAAFLRIICRVGARTETCSQLQLLVLLWQA